MTLSVIGGTVGLGLGWFGMRVLAALQPPGLLPTDSITMHGKEVGFALLLSAFTGLLFGVAPALWSSCRIPAEVLKEGGRAGSGGRSLRRWGGAMVVAEVSLAVLLTLGAGLLVRSYWQLQHVDPGFNANGVMTMSLSLPSARYDSARKVIAFYDELTQRARALPGVTSGATISNLPATSYSWSSDFSVAGRASNAFGTEVVHREMTGEYAQVMPLELKAGRYLARNDNASSPMVVVINNELARRYFPNEDPIGKRVAFDKAPDSSSTWRTIVGVVGSERQAGMAQPPRPEFTTPFAQEPRQSMTLVMRTNGGELALAAGMRRIVADMDSRLAISSMRTMNAVRADSVTRERFMTVILLAFAAVGFVLAIVGVYGVMAQTARGRTREMGIRIALGAPARRVQWLVVRYGLQLSAAGIAVGVTGAVVGARALSALLYEVQPLDGPTFIFVPLLLGLAAVAASWLPAWRASRVDPAVTLRSE